MVNIMFPNGAVYGVKNRQDLDFETLDPSKLTDGLREAMFGVDDNAPSYSLRWEGNLIVASWSDFPGGVYWNITASGMIFG